MKLKVTMNKEILLFSGYIFLLNSFLVLPIQVRTAMQLATTYAILFMLKYVRRLFYAGSRYKVLLFIFLAYIIFSAFRAERIFGRKLSIQNILYMIYPIFSWPFYLIFYRNMSEKKLNSYIKILKYVCLAMLVCLTLIGLLIMFSDVTFTNLHVSNRNGRVRIVDGIDFIVFVWLLCLSNVCRSKNFKPVQRSSGLDWIILIYGFLYVYLIQQTRILLLFELGCILAAALTVLPFHLKRILAVVVLCMGIGAVFAIPATRNIIDNFLGSFNAVSDSSTSNRIAEIEYYSEMIKEHLVFGYGPIEGDELKTLIRGPKLRFYPEDLGIYGFIFYYGLLSAIWYVIFLLTGLREAWKKRHAIPELFYFKIYLIGSAFTMLIFDGIRAAVLPVWILIAETLKKMENGNC